MTNAQPPDAMRKLLLLIIGIAILGTIIALAVHYGVELPAQDNMKAPGNSGCSSSGGVCSLKFNACLKGCGSDGDCKTECAKTYMDANGCFKEDPVCPPYTPPQ